MALKPFNSVAGFSVGETPANIILANGDITTNNITTTGVANLNSISNVRISGGSNGQVIQTDGVGNLSFVTIDTWRIQNGNSNVQVLANSNVTVSVSGNANIATFTSTGFEVSGYINAGNISANGNLSANNYLVTPASANLIIAPATQLTRIYSNVNPYNDNAYDLGNGLARWGNIFANIGNFTGNLSVSGTANVGNLRTDNLLYANGQPWDLQEAAGSNTQIQFNNNNNFGASANFTFDSATNNLRLNGNILLGNSNQNQIVPLSNTSLEIRGGWNDGVATGINLVAGDYANSTNWGKLAILGNYSGNSVGFSEANAFVFTNPGYGSGNVVKIDILNPTSTSNTTGVIQANGGIGVTGNGYFGENLVVTGNIANANNVSVTNALNANTGNFSGNINSLNANLGNLVEANFINIASNTLTSNLTVNLELAGNTANFSGNVIVPNLTVNLELAGNTANFTGNVVAANFIGDLANGTSNVKVYNNSNVEISIGGVANIATVASTGLYVVGEINTTAGNMLSNGNVTANGFLNGANANVTGEGKFGSVLTANITAPTGNITISATGVDQNINLVPTGNGAVDVSNFKITQLADPTNPKDAVTKEYVDNASKGLTIHNAVRVTSLTNLNATYANGGSVLTTIAITGGKTIQFSAAHGLSVGDELAWDNSFNGIVGDDPYFVYSTPAADTITVKAGYFGAEVTTLTNGTGLSQTARANTGVGATLTNAGANAAISIDGITLSSTNRVLVQGQTNQVENGVYTVTTVGNGSTAWVLTRATDEDTYSPTATNALGYGDYFFVQQGTSYAGSSYTLTSPVGEILFGYTNIAFSQFSAAGAYTAGNGINITGTIISANTDGVTTDIVGGNIVVKAGANLTTPNLGDATFSSLSWNTLSNGNVTANNLSIGNIANITLDLTVGGNIQANGTISSNANVSGLNLTTNGNVEAAGNVLANNVNANALITAANANISTNLITSNATVNLELSGNTANFSGNVIVPNLTVNLTLAGNTANFTGNIVANNTTVNLELSGNTANFSGNVVVPNITVNTNIAGNTANFTGNISAANANLGNLATANFFTGTFINGTSNIAIPTTNGNVNITAGGNTSLVVTATGANITGNLGVSGNFTVGSLQSDNLTANLNVFLGNTTITWDTVTTTSVTANQTIASISTTGITGLEFLVKGEDAGGRYSVATVIAVTDGSNVDFATFGTVQLGGYTGSLAVNVVSGNVELQVTPGSSNSTVWTTQARLI